MVQSDGRATQAHESGRTLVHLESDEVDANWLYLASLRSLSDSTSLIERVEKAAESTVETARRHGFQRLGVVTFGGESTDTEQVAKAMLRSLYKLAGQSTIFWFETNAERFSQT